MENIDLACQLLKEKAVDLEQSAEARGRKVKAFVIREGSKIVLTVQFLEYEIEMSMTMWDSTLFFNEPYKGVVNAIFARLTDLALNGDYLSILSVKRLLVAESN